MTDDRSYRIILKFRAKDESFSAEVPELDVSVNAKTRGEALTLAEEAIDSQVEQRAVEGEELPAPIDNEATPESISVKLAAPIYHELLFTARKTDSDPGHVAAQMIALALGNQSRPRPKEPDEPSRRPKADSGAHRKRRGRKRERHHGNLDDKAEFLEYVRGLEKGPRRR